MAHAYVCCPSIKMLAVFSATNALVVLGAPATTMHGNRCPEMLTGIFEQLQCLEVNRIKSTAAFAAKLATTKVFRKIAHQSPRQVD
jgi:hypothetical protein